MARYRAATIIFFTFITICLHTNISHAQLGLNSTDIRSIQSSDISDTQLRAAIVRAEEEGLTIDQALQMAQARGLSSSVANQLRSRIRSLQMEGDISADDPAFEEEPDAYDFARQFMRPEREETEQMRRTFGSEVFKYRETEFTPNLNVATPVNYTLAPGDEISVNIWGDQTNTYQLTVNPEGAVLIENIGPVYVNGLTIEEANDLIVERLQEIYSGLRGGGNEQTTFARISVNRLRTIQVAIIGEATNPGDYTMPSNSTVFNALYRGGGPGEDGSYREIRVLRDNEVVAVLDLYDYLVDGVQENNIRLREQDVIHIPTYKNRVEVIGEVKRDSLYFETRDGETISDLIEYAGGFTNNAFTDQILIHRNTSRERKILTVDRENFHTASIQNGDVLYVDEILNRFENRVSISGAVWRSGEFELTEGMKLSDLLQQAEGVRPDAFGTRGLINRLKDDYRLEQISFSVSGVLENPERYDIPLKREDHVMIRSIHEMKDEQTVQINGAIRQPGEYNHRDGMTLEDLILQANGFTEAASEARLEISRRIQGEPAPDQRGERLADIYTFDVSPNLSLPEADRIFKLQPYDRVYVHRRPDYQVQKTVTIEGEVMFPGTYTIEDRNERISDLIERAGGLTNEAYQPGARLIRQHTAIDRPEIEFDFLSEEELLDEEQTGLLGLQDNQALRERQMEEMRRSQEQELMAEEEQKNSNRNGEESDFFEQRYEMNRQNFRPQKEDSLSMEEDSGHTESRIGINLSAILDSPGSREDLFLRDGDVLRVPQELQTVAISGAVMQDVEVRYHEGAGMGYYIDRAGGFATNARKKNVYVVYANGDVDRRKNYLFGLIKNSPPIEPGTHIIIPAKAPREKMNFGELVSISAAVVGMSTSLIIAIDRLSR